MKRVKKTFVIRIRYKAVETGHVSADIQNFLEV